MMFDLRYLKTGGGEDIDFSRPKREASLKNGGGTFEPAPSVVVMRPWWNEGNRLYWRFYMWSFGDGALVTRFPDLTYQDWVFNTPEALAVCLIGSLLRIVHEYSQTRGVVPERRVRPGSRERRPRPLS